MFSNSLHYALILLNSLVWFLCRKVNSWFTGKDPDAGKDWRQEEKETTEDETVGWLHRFNGHDLGQAPRDGEGQGDLACCSPWGHKESDMTWWLNNNKARSSPMSPYHYTQNTGREVWLKSPRFKETSDAEETTWLVLIVQTRTHSRRTCPSCVPGMLLESKQTGSQCKLFYLFVLSIFESLILKLQLKILIYLLKI